MLRHRVNLIDDDIQGWINQNYEILEEYLLKGWRVLIICNTVKKAQDIYASLRSKFDVNSALVHSRFALIDRERIESKIKDVQLLVDTQAIEVSLDIDFDIMFTEIAPADRLFQRFGRVNRKGRRQLSDVFIFTAYLDEERKIYDEQVLIKTLNELRGVNELSEYDVRCIVDSVYEGGFTSRQMDIFNETKESFLKIRSYINPFVENGTSEEDFYSLVQSKEIVPSVYENDYLELIESKNYFEIIKFYLPVAIGQFAKLLKGDKFTKLKEHIFAGQDISQNLGF